MNATDQGQSNLPQSQNPTPQDGTAPGRGGLRWLDWVERRGVLDCALAIVLLAQWRIMPLPPGAPMRVFRRPTVLPDSLWGIAVLPLLTWLILAAGALAPLSRRRTVRGELPPGSGIWLAAYGLMAASWFAILLNTFPGRFWGFAHLACFDRGESEWLALAIPALLAPGWRRLGRAVYWRWATRRRRKGFSPDRPKFQITIFKSIGLALLLAGFAWTLTDYAIMSDGFGIIQFASTPGPPNPNQYREPGTLLLLKGAALALRPLGLDTAQSIHFANFLAMAGVLGLIGYAMRLMDLNRAQRRAGWWLSLSSLGITQMLAGRIELYPLVELAIAATVAFGMAAAAGRRSPGWMCAAFSLGLAGHLSLIFLLPVVLLALWLWVASGAGVQRRGARAASWPRALAHLFGWGAAVHLPLWYWLMTKLPDPTPRGLVRAVTGSLNTGARGVIEARMGQYTWAAKLGRLVRADTVFNPVQVLFYLAGAALLLAILAGGVWAHKKMQGRKGPQGPKEKGGCMGEEDARRRRQAWILAAAFAGYFVYAYAWPNDWPWSEDWDLFSGITPLAVLLVLRMLMPARGVWRLPGGVLRRVCWFSFLLALSQNIYNHRYASFLNSLGKITVSPVEGRMIQQYQLDHGWVRGHNYVVRNGNVVELPAGEAP